MEYKAIFVAIIGLILLIWPNFNVRRLEKSHATRMNELNAGADERYFEERRSLEAYPPRRRGLWWRLLGGLLILIAASALFPMWNPLHFK